MDTTKIFNDFILFLEQLSESQWNTKVDNSWTVKDVIAHLIGWNLEAQKALKEYWESSKEPWFLATDDYTQFNQNSVKKYKKLSYKELLNQFKKSENDFDKLIQEIGEDNLRKKFSKESWVFDETGNNHYLEHFKQIKDVLKKQDPTCETGLQKNIIDKALFDRELSLCKKLNKENGGKCCWGQCNQCGVIPFLYKLHKGIIIDNQEDLDKVRKDLFKSEKQQL